MEAKRGVSPRKSSPAKKQKVSSGNVAGSTNSTQVSHEDRVKELGLKKIWTNALKDYELVQQLG